MAYSATVGSTSNASYAVSFPGWALAFAVFAVAACLPSGGEARYARPTVRRLLVVHMPVMAAVWLAAWRYMFRHTTATTVTMVIGVLAGLLIIAEQLAAWYHTSTLSDRLRDNIANLRHTEAELRALLDDLPDSVIVLDGRGRIVEANKLALETTGRSHARGARADVHFAGEGGGPAETARRVGQVARRRRRRHPRVRVQPSRRTRVAARGRCARARCAIPSESW